MNEPTGYRPIVFGGVKYYLTNPDLIAAVSDGSLEFYEHYEIVNNCLCCGRFDRLPGVTYNWAAAVERGWIVRAAD